MSLLKSTGSRVAAAAVAGAVGSLVLVGVGVVVGVKLGDTGPASSRQPAASLNPNPSTPGATPSGPSPTPSASSSPASSAAAPTVSAAATRTVAPPAKPNWSKIRYSMDCGGAGVEVAKAIDTHDFTGDHRPEAVRVVNCVHGAGSPGQSVLVFTANRDGTPRLLQTLLSDKDGLQVGKDLSVYKNGIIGSAFGYSANSVPRCCPDLEGQIQWEWRKNRFVELAGPNSE